MTTYVTSDLHLGHNKEFIYSERGFSTIETHDDHIVDYWKHTVTVNDTLIVVGDLFMGKNKLGRARELFSTVNGNYIWILGNHDPSCGNLTGILEGLNVIVVHDTYETIVDGRKTVFCHYPPTGFSFDRDGIEDTRYDHRRPQYEPGTVYFHGHTHSHEVCQISGVYHVGWDAWGKFPTVDEVLATRVKETL